MSVHKTAGKMAIIAFCIALGGVASATTYSYSGIVTHCSTDCDTFDSLEAGVSTLSFTFNINTTPGGVFGDSDIGGFTMLMFNPTLPTSGPVGDPLHDNPLIIDLILGIVSSNGTAGTIDASNDINGGQVLLEFLVQPFSGTGAFMIFDFDTGIGQICLFYETDDCIPGETEFLRFGFSSPPAIPIPAALWLFGSALLGVAGFGRRNTG